MQIIEQLKSENRLRAAAYVGPSPEVRHPRWSFHDVASNRDASLFSRLVWDAMSLIFPDGERFFIRSVRHFADQVKDPELQKDIRAFIAQEVQHGRLHEVFNSTVTAKRYNIDGFLKFMSTTAYDWLENFANAINPKFALSVTAAAEHFTATWGRTALQSERVNNIRSDDLRELILWHALEELEHKHVAFDVLRQVDDSYTLRIGGMLVTAGLMSFYITTAFLWLLAQEKEIDFAALLHDVANDVSDREGVANRFLVSFLSYLRPGYHPRDEDDSLLIEQTRERLKNSLMLSVKTA